MGVFVRKKNDIDVPRYFLVCVFYIGELHTWENYFPLMEYRNSRRRKSALEVWKKFLKKVFQFAILGLIRSVRNKTKGEQKQLWIAR